MPEGDTIHGAADRLGAALEGDRVTAATGSHRAMIGYGKRVVGAAVEEVAAVGKHLLIHFDNGWTLRTHLRMTGQWHVYAPGERWSKTPGKARVVLETSSHVAVCFAAPTVQLAPRHLVEKQIAHLGPDLMEDVDSEAVADRLLNLAPDSPIADAIVDQRVVAGLGNVYRSELLFLEGLHPTTPVAAVERTCIASLVRRGHALLATNRGRRRTTTGRRADHLDTWVYERAGRPCRRCGMIIELGRSGPLGRTVYWCPSCQPAPPAT